MFRALQRTTTISTQRLLSPSQIYSLSLLYRSYTSAALSEEKPKPITVPSSTESQISPESKSEAGDRKPQFPKNDTRKLKEGLHSNENLTSHNGAAAARPELEDEEGALSRRLTQMTEDALLQSPSSAKNAISSGDFHFSEELKRELEARIANTDFKAANAQAFAIANIPAAAGKHTRDIALSRAWTGTEPHEDAILRMLVDAHKPLKGDPTRRRPPPTIGPVNIDLRPTPKTTPRSPGARVAAARERSMEYSINKDTAESLTPLEKAEMSSMFRERFAPGGRAAGTVAAITSLADQRIEEARARGQFKNLPRGKPLERDHNADSPFLDTTEYFLNRIIKRQEIVPPWIEKQQELILARDTFRKRLRQEWKRHVVRVIASQGGSLDEQISRAEKYAEGEKLYQQSQQPPSSTSAPTTTPTLPATPSTLFRDSTYLTAEHAYHTLSIASLNSLTRSYNLLAPELAKKPYFTLARELNSCFADVAPLIASELRARASAPPPKIHRLGGGGGGNEEGLWEKVSGKKARVYDEVRPKYGFRELWRDLFGGGKRADRMRG